MIHSEAHPLAGQTVTLALSRDAPDFKSGDEYRIEDWWDRVSGRSWMDASGNPAAMMYMASGLGFIDCLLTMRWFTVKSVPLVI